MTGKVYLVGAGPGDPGLLTMRAAELIARADFIAIDALVSRRHRRSRAEDRRGRLRRQARQRTRAAAGPDQPAPHRRSEEREDASSASKAAIRSSSAAAAKRRRSSPRPASPFEIVPGISSAIAGPAYAGIPVTHRSYATSLTLVTGHEADASTGIKWEALAQLDGTIVFMMGFANLADDRAEADRERHLARSPGRRDLESDHAPSSAPSPARCATSKRSVAEAEPADAGADRGRRSREAARRHQLVRVEAALRQAHRRHPRPRTSLGTQTPLRRIGRDGPAVPDHRDRAAGIVRLARSPSIDERFDWLVFTSTNGVRASSSASSRKARTSARWQE